MMPTDSTSVSVMDSCYERPNDSTSVSVMDSCYERLKEDVLSFKEKGRVVLLGDFNARVGRSAQIDAWLVCLGKIRAMLVEIDCFPF